MNNQEIARVLSDIADFLEAKEIRFKPRAYRQAAEFIERSSQDIAGIYRQKGVDGLEALPAIGENIAAKIGELVNTGTLKYYQRLQKQLPVAMGELTAVEGVGPKTVQALYKKLKITNLQELEQAARQHKIHELSGFKEKTEENILRGIDLLKKTKERRPLRAVLPVAEAILKKIKQHQSVSQAEVAGSLRRRESTVGDIDMLAVSSRGKEVVDLFCGLPEVDHVYSKGSTKALVRLKQGIDADLRVVPAKSFGAALQYFTGNKAHSIATRKLAQKRGMKLNEYGLFKGEKPVAGRSEQGIYRALGLPHIPPEERNEKLPITDKRSNEKA